MVGTVATNSWKGAAMEADHIANVHIRLAHIQGAENLSPSLTDYTVALGRTSGSGPTMSLRVNDGAYNTNVTVS